jgi:hypothetical protein
MIKEGKLPPKTSGGETGVVVVVVCWVTLVFDVVDTVLETVLEDVVEVVWLIG